MRKMIVATLLLATCVHCAHAEPHAIRGWGAANCAEYLNYYRDDPKVVDELTLSWVWGFMSGFQMLATRPSGLTQVNPEAAKLFLRNYCSQHPTDAYYVGILHFMDTIPRFQLKLKP